MVEAYYSAKRIAALLGFSDKWVIERIRSGDFGPACFYANGDYRVPASGVNDYIRRNPVPAEPDPIRARSIGEARRKLKESTRLDAAA